LRQWFFAIRPKCDAHHRGRGELAVPSALRAREKREINEVHIYPRAGAHDRSTDSGHDSGGTEIAKYRGGRFDLSARSLESILTGLRRLCTAPSLGRGFFDPEATLHALADGDP